MTNTCEYTGKLWFMRRSGIQFRETVRICTEDRGSSSTMSSSLSSSSVECLTKYKHKNEWVDCSKVICTFAIPPPPSTEEEDDGTTLSNTIPTRKKKKKKTIAATTTTSPAAAGGGGGGEIVVKKII